MTKVDIEQLTPFKLGVFFSGKYMEIDVATDKSKMYYLNIVRDVLESAGVDIDNCEFSYDAEVIKSLETVQE